MTTEATNDDAPTLTDHGIRLEANPLVDLDELRSDHNDHLEVVAETDDRVVFVDYKRHELKTWAEDMSIDLQDLSEAMHEQAREVSDYDWSASDPLVIAK